MDKPLGKCVVCNRIFYKLKDINRHIDDTKHAVYCTSSKRLEKAKVEEIIDG